MKWHHGANVLLAGTVSGDVYMWRIPGGDCKLLPGGGVKTDCGLILPDGMHVIYSDGIILYCEFFLANLVDSTNISEECAVCVFVIEGSVVKKVKQKAEWVSKNKEWSIRVRDGEESTWALGLVSGKSSSP
jgi:hypothetical protein